MNIFRMSSDEFDAMVLTAILRFAYRFAVRLAPAHSEKGE